MQFFSLSLKPNVLDVWLAKCGRKMVENNKNSTNHPLIRHGINLTSIELDKV